MLNKIVPFHEKDHDKLVDIWYRAVRSTHTFLKEGDFQFYHSLVHNGALKEAELWVGANSDDNPLGFIGLDANKIEMLFIDPDYHGQGIGTEFIKHAMKLKGNALQVDVNEQNEGAYTFYKKHGFVTIGRSELDGSGRPYPILHLELVKHTVTN